MADSAPSVHNRYQGYAGYAGWFLIIDLSIYVIKNIVTQVCDHSCVPMCMTLHV